MPTGLVRYLSYIDRPAEQVNAPASEPGKLADPQPAITADEDQQAIPLVNRHC
jgi:hypothetical protein